MKLAISTAISALLLVPTVALACPYASSAAETHACAGCSPLAGYVTWLLVGLGVGFASVRRR